MYRFLLLISLWCCSIIASVGQNISVISIVEPASSRYLCPNKNLVVAYLTSGAFNADNKFSIQLEYDSYLSSTKEVLTLETKDSLGFLVGKIPTSITKYITENQVPYYNINVVSSSPVVSATLGGSQGSLPVGELPSLTITQKGKVYIPQNGSATITLRGRGSSPFTLSTLDGRKFEAFGYGPGGINDVQMVLSTQKSETLNFSTIQNACGVGQISGKVDVVVTENSLKFASLDNRFFCKGANMQLPINKIGNWNADNKYVIELTSELSGTVYTTEATEKDGIVTGKVPTLLNTGNYTVRVYTTSPEATTATYTISIFDATQLTLRSVSESSITFGTSVVLNVGVTGASPILYELSDGTKGRFINPYGNSFEITVNPQASQTYKFKSVSGVCGTGVGVGEVAVTVKEGIAVKSLERKKYCLGDTLRANYSSSKTLIKGTSIKGVIKLSGYPDTNVELSGVVKQDGVAEFMLPKSLDFVAQAFSMALTVNNTSIQDLVFTKDVATLNKIPAVTSFAADYAIPILDKSGTFTYRATFSGGDMVTYRNSLNQTFTLNSLNSSAVDNFYQETTSIQILSVSNLCGVNNTPSNVFTVIVKNPDKIRLITPFQYGAEICADSKINLEIQTIGTFNADCKFYLDLVNESGYVLKEGVAEFINNKTVWNAASSNGYYPQKAYLQVRATSPYTIAQKIAVATIKKPEYTRQTTFNFNYTKGGYNETPSIICDNAYNYTAKLSNGNTFTSNGSGTVYFEVDTKKSTAFAVTSLSNQCGTTDLNVKFNISYIYKYVGFYEGNYDNSFKQTLCKGQKLNVKYYETYASSDYPVTTPNYRLEISKESNFSNPTVIKNNIAETELSVSMPEDLAAGNYYMRLVDEQTPAISSPVKLIVYQLPPTPVSTIDGQTAYSIKLNQTIVLKKDPTTEEYVYNEQGYSYLMTATNELGGFMPRVSGVYKISSSINQCGKIDNPLSIKVTVSPIIEWRSNLVINNESVCTGTKILFYVNSTDPTASNKYTLRLSNQTGVKTDIFETTKTGWQWAEIPKTIPYSYYRLEMIAQEGDVSNLDSQRSFYVNSPPMMNMLGNITINYGQTGNLTLVPQITPINPYQTFSYTLSNGAVGTFTNYNYSSFSVIVSPRTSQNITFTKISNMCGLGEVKGSAQVTVNPESSKQIEHFVPFRTKMCAGSKVEIMYSTTGSFGSNAKFEVQISDKNGQNFKTINSAPIPNATNYLLATLPVDLPEGNEYRFKVISSEANSTGASTMSPLSVASVITAEFDTTKYFYSSADKPVNLKVNAKGKFPIGVYIGPDGLTSKYYEISKSPFEIPFLASTAKQFQIFRVYNNECGEGSVGAKNIATLELVTGLEDIQSLGVVIGPNPTSDYIAINCDEPNIKYELIDMLGNQVSEQLLQAGVNVISLQKFNSGVFHVKISKANKIAVFKLIKTN